MNASSDKVVKHIALGHSKLDEMLQDEELVQRKRDLQSTKPKRENIGPICPICDVRDPPREHVARHFGEALNDLVANLEDPLTCQECNYRGEKAKNLGLHIALVHGQLDVFLKNKSLVKRTRSRYLSQPKKLNIGPKCPVCDIAFTKSQNRDHVAWHFIDELRDFVQSFDDPHKCWSCDYRSEKMDNLVKHVALGHSKLDELLNNRALLQEKRQKILTKPKRVVIGPSCPICGVKEPAREHVARHFSDELLAIVNSYPDPTICVECEYKADKPKTLSIHVGLVHAKLDVMLLDPDLLDQKRENYQAKPKKLSIGPYCPVCDVKFTKSQNRDHVSWHYIEELRAIVQEFDDPNQCPQCPYKADTNEKMVKHVALGHSMLDALLQDENLLELKRMKAQSKPKKVILGSTCPICDSRDPSREHVARHFSDELNDIVQGFSDPTHCTQCAYKSDRSKNVAIHIALVHSILDHFLSDQDLVSNKREQFSAKPQKVNVGNSCPICDVEFPKGQNRDHVCWHFMDELRDIVLSFQDTTKCNECSYSSDRLDNLVKHVALGHSKLDELLSDIKLVNHKRRQALSKPKKIQIGPKCPICDMTFVKAQNRDHVSWHFIEELRDFVYSTGSEKSCQLCYYTTDKMDNLVKHYALGHSKLDELLKDKSLIERKRDEQAKKPKRLSFGPDCPICQETGRDRDHVSRHFMSELLEIVNLLPKKSQCDQCNYRSNKPEYMAKHIALYHCKLDELMANEALVEAKQKSVANKPERVSMGEKCVICGMGYPQREHVARHFQPELLEIIKEFENPLSCALCSFSTHRMEYMARHVGLVHRRLDEMMTNENLVKEKIAEFSRNPGTLVVNVKIEPVRKSQRTIKPVYRDEPTVSLKRKSPKEKSRHVKNGPVMPLKIRPPIKIKHKVEPFEEPMEKIDESPCGSSSSEMIVDDFEPISKKIKFDNQSDDAVSSMAFFKDQAKSSFTCLPDFKKSPPAILNEDAQTSAPRFNKKEKIEPKVTIEKAFTSLTPVSKPNNGGTSSVSLLKASLLKRPIASKPTNSMPPLASLLKQPIKPTNILNSLLKPSPTVKITKKESTITVPALPSSISLTPTVPKIKVAELLQSQKPLQPLQASTSSGLPLKPVLDTASIADINNSWAESLMSNSSHGKVAKLNVNTSGSAGNGPISGINDEGIKTIGSCTLTPATGKKAKSPTVSSNTPSISLQKISGGGTSTNTFVTPTLISASVTLTPADPKSRPTKRLKMNTMPTATITPLTKRNTNNATIVATNGGGINVKPLFPSKPLEKAELGTMSFGTLGRPLISTASIVPVSEESISQDLIEEEHDLEDESENMILEPQIFIHDPNDEEDEMEYDEVKDDAQVSPEQDQKVEAVEENIEQVTEKNADDDEEFGQVVEEVDTEEGDKQLEVEDFCDLCGMELEHHPDNQPCPPDDDYRPEFPRCPLCNKKEPTKEHVAKHYMAELKEMVEAFEDSLACNQCDYQSEKNSETVALHMALNHDLLKSLIIPNENPPNDSEDNIKKVILGSTCPICEFKDPTREHASRHFMNELLDHVATLPDHSQCRLCSYHGEKPQNLAKHIALVHNMLDKFLSDDEMIQKKRTEAMIKPKKISIGSTCPVCLQSIQKRDSRVHVIWHFMEELREIVQEFPDTTICPYCPYTNPNPDKMAKHMALGHSKLDELLSDNNLVAMKRQRALSKPKKLNIGPECPICGLQFTKSQNRDHVSWHFMDELRDYVQTFQDPQQCNQCEYRSDKLDNLVKHLALGHSKLDELLMNQDLVFAKKELAKAKPKKVSIGPTCPICDLAFTKSQNRDHVSWHFMDELRTLVNDFDAPQKCNQCDYQAEKVDNMVKHLALGHSKLDQFLLDENLVAAKRRQHQASRK